MSGPGSRESAAVASIERSLAGLGAHDHACVFYGSERERSVAAGTFARGAVGDGARLLYLASRRSAGAVAADLRGGVASEEPLGTGQLVVRTAEEAYLAGGRFEPEPVIELLAEEARAARADGWSGLRVIGEMDWALCDGGDVGELLDYEARVDEVFERTGAAAICLYDGRAFDAPACTEAAHLHHLVVAPPGGPLAAWQLARIGRAADGALVVAGEIDISNAASLGISLRAEAARRRDLRVDLSELSFIDLAGIRAICEVGAEIGARGGKLSLAAPPRAAVTAFEMLRLDDLGWLRWEAGE